jgi:hypothetical protein
VLEIHRRVEAVGGDPAKAVNHVAVVKVKQPLIVLDSWP